MVSINIPKYHLRNASQIKFSNALYFGLVEATWMNSLQ